MLFWGAYKLLERVDWIKLLQYEAIQHAQHIRQHIATTKSNFVDLVDSEAWEEIVMLARK